MISTRMEAFQSRQTKKSSTTPTPSGKEENTKETKKQDENGQIEDGEVSLLYEVDFDNNRSLALFSWFTDA